LDLEEGLAELDNYKALLYRRVKNPKMRTRKLFFTKGIDFTAKVLLGKIDAVLVEAVELMEAQEASTFQELTEGARGYLNRKVQSLLPVIKDAFQHNPQKICGNYTSYFLETSWSGGKPRARVWVTVCYTLSEDPKHPEDEVWIPSFTGKTEAGKILCPVCGWEGEEVVTV
jgi:hypothetical protein